MRSYKRLNSDRLNVFTVSELRLKVFEENVFLVMCSSFLVTGNFQAHLP